MVCIRAATHFIFWSTELWVYCLVSHVIPTCVLQAFLYEWKNMIKHPNKAKKAKLTDCSDKKSHTKYGFPGRHGPSRRHLNTPSCAAHQTDMVAHWLPWILILSTDSWELWGPLISACVQTQGLKRSGFLAFDDKTEVDCPFRIQKVYQFRDHTWNLGFWGGKDVFKMVARRFLAVSPASSNHVVSLKRNHQLCIYNSKIFHLLNWFPVLTEALLSCRFTNPSQCWMQLLRDSWSPWCRHTIFLTNR